MNKSLFKVVDWEEHFVVDKKIAHAKATYSIEGYLNGEIQVNYSIYYFDYNLEEVHDSSSRFEGFGCFSGEIEGKKGSFFFYDSGCFINHEYQARIDILKESGTDDLIGISGSGKYAPVALGMELILTLD